MPLNKQPININFAQGLDTKTDPKQVQLGKFLSLQNTIFDKGGLLQKRNGFGQLTTLPDSTATYATTFNGNLTTVGNKLQAYSLGSKTWINKGSIQPLELSTLSLIRSNTNQSQCDSVVSSSGLVCTVYTDQNPSNLSNSVYKYVIADSVTGQNIIPPTLIPVTSGTVTNSPRVFLLGNYFIIVFQNVITATNHLQYVAISTSNPTVVSTNKEITSLYSPSSDVAFDGCVYDDKLYLAWNGSDLGGAIRMANINTNLLLSNTVIFAGYTATHMSVSIDSYGNTPDVYASFYNSATSLGYTLAVNQNLLTVLNPTQWISSGTVKNITSIANNHLLTIYYELDNSYTYDSSIKSNYIKTVTVTQAGVVGTSATFARSVGLASKAFLINGIQYVMGVYSSPYQPTYFLFNQSGSVIAKLAYQNAGGYLTKGLPNITVSNNIVKIPYLFKDLIQSVNKNTNIPSGSQVNGIYAQLGISLASFTIGTSNISSAEIGNTLNLSGGFMWSYDGYSPVENNFFLYPDSVKATWSATGGSMAAQPNGSTNTNAYYYQVTYEWADNQGNINRSSPSIPVSVTTTGALSTGSVVLNVPTLRLTYKTANPVKIVIYRWSVAQQTYYQVTSIIQPVLNSISVDSVTFTDTLADASILGNNIIYTNGGVIENISPPACSAITLFDNRIFALSAEDGSVWYSKQVLPTTPVEMSDLFTIYVAPTIGASGSTGEVKCIFPMDDKIIFFKQDAIYYLNGNGPDNTGANSQYSQPNFITATVGSANQQSMVFTPNGLMFQSDKGIWLLGRNLQTEYIGAPVEAFNDAKVLSAITIPGTNQVRFTLDNGVTLMYDYYYGQWGTFTNIPAISSTLYQNLHTYINKFGQVFQETPNVYLDGSSPVTVSLKTSWFNLAGLQGFQRLYFFYLIGQYISPHKLRVEIAYDYAPAPSQQIIISPFNYSPVYGLDINFGSGTPYGGQPALEQWQVFVQRQLCQSFQISISEVYDSSFNLPAGAGLTLSGIDAVVGMKKGYYPVRRNST